MSTTRRRFVIPAVAALALLLGCPQPTTPRPFTTSLFAIDSINGNVYEVDGEGLVASSTPIVTVGPAAGEIEIAAGKAFVAVGNSTGGLHCFDPSSPASGATMIGDAMSAQYIAVASSTLAYVSVGNYSEHSSDGLYSFNPSNPLAGLSAKIAGTGVYAQGVAIGSDGRVYLADNGNGKVLKLNAAADDVEASITATKWGTTYLLAGSYDFDDDGDTDIGIFVGNTGDFSTGSLDFVATTAANGSDATSVVSGPVISRIAAFDSTHLIVTGGWGSTAKTFIINVSTNPATKSEVLSGGVSFGGADITVRDGIAYLADGNGTIYSVNSNGNVIGKIVIGASGEMITNLCSAD